MWERAIPNPVSVFSRFRLAGLVVILGVGLAGAAFYGVLNSLYVSSLLSQTLGPFSDTLADRGFGDPDPTIWGRLAAGHGVSILVEPAEGPAFAFDDAGQPISLSAEPLDGPVRAVRAGPDGGQVTFYWTVFPIWANHFTLLAGLLLMISGIVATVFWFLHLQLKPLAALQTGVDAVARGDLDSRVEVVRPDEIGHVAEAFNEMTARVSEMVEARERLLADVSHELRSPIARMKVALDLMPEGEKHDQLQLDLREMESLIAVLLERQALKQVEDLRVASIDLRELAEQASTAVSRSPGVRLASTGNPELTADRDLVSLLVRNLVDNALKFSDAKSEPVLVEIDGDEADVVVLRVLDRGVGIPEGKEAQLLEPFVKAKPERGHRAGYGLGLDLCRRIVELHGGELNLRSRKPRGTKALVELPRRPRASTSRG